MKLKSEMTRSAPNDGYIMDAEKQRKANEEKYDFFSISPGNFLCVSGETAYTISEYMRKISCACEDMTYNCTGKEICKHLIKFMMLENPHELPEIREDMAQLLKAAGWSGIPMTPPDRPENRKRKPKLPNINDPARKPVKAAQREERRKAYSKMTVDEIVRGMAQNELEKNARKGGVAAQAEVARRAAVSA